MSNINTIMEGGDTISGSLAECYYTLNGRRYNGMQFVSVEAKVTKTIYRIFCIKALTSYPNGYIIESWKGDKNK